MLCATTARSWLTSDTGHTYRSIMLQQAKEGLMVRTNLKYMKMIVIQSPRVISRILSLHIGASVSQNFHEELVK